MSDDCTLEEELEQELLVGTEENFRSPLLSTPRKRLENARIMAKNASAACRSADDTGREPTTHKTDDNIDGNGASLVEDTSMHYLLQKLSCAMADNGEWECFHDINSESQRALAEMNETLGSLRQWQKQRDVMLPSSTTSAPEDVSTTTAWLSLRSSRPIASGEATSSAGNHTNNIIESATSVIAGHENDKQRSIHENTAGDEQDRLLLLWQEQHLRAQQAAGRLQEQMQGHPRRSRNDDDSDPATNPEETAGTTPTKARDIALLIRGLLARREDGGPSYEEKNPASLSVDGGGADREAGLDDRVADLRRDVDGLQMREWIKDTRSNACDRAHTLAREAGEDVRLGTGSDAVREIEGELDGFAKEVDSLLLRIDNRGGGDGEEEQRYRAGGDGDVDDDENDVAAQHQRHLPGEGVAPAADVYIGEPVQ